ncbi:Wadjet anti-phage system protein JetD domain-containing protein [Ruminiclostridium cellobioparum]|uniref:Wadjet anti-phage system protein JetD domain-containing protein n=1 Tax=Ruminiclostridium cellobioparum TaxID=29355 RepID=UPI0004852EEE|nr:Wadjet anti-phage system protein JetD domain-containing protein [Ruminiclostridium cellobioparum]
MLEQEIFIVLQKVINDSKNKFVPLRNLFSAVESINPDMPVFLQSPEGQAAFLSSINALVYANSISSVGNKTNHKGLHDKYKINKQNEKKDNQLISEIIRNITLPAVLDYYLKNSNDYLKDKDIIDIILNYIKKKEGSVVTVNERAYELFGDEKFFKGDEKDRSRGGVVLKRLGLNYEQLGCIETVEPFFSFQKKDFYLKQVRNIYIIENKDTFWSFKRSVMDSPAVVKPDMLIYGEGKKIISSFKYIDEYEINPGEDTIHYFGDLDAEGINIYCDLKSKFQKYNIIPFYKGYEAVLETGLKKGPAKTPRQQRVSDDNILQFVNGFDINVAVKIRRLINGGLYIPQEALSSAGMKERFRYNHD